MLLPTIKNLIIYHNDFAKKVVRSWCAPLFCHIEFGNKCCAMSLSFIKYFFLSVFRKNDDDNDCDVDGDGDDDGGGGGGGDGDDYGTPKEKKRKTQNTP